MVVRTVLPPAGTPGVFDPRNPTLIPNFDRNQVKGADNSMPPTVNHSSPAGFLVANPRTNASATATIGGTVTTGDEITLELANPVFPGGLFSHTYTTVGGDTVTTIAEALADLFNDDPVAALFDIEVDVAGAVLTFNQSGPVGNFSTLTAPVGEPATLLMGGTSLTGDAFNVLFTGPQFGAGVLVQLNATTGHSATTNATDLAAAITANAALIALGISAVGSSTKVVLTVPAAAEPVNIAAWVNTIAPSISVSTGMPTPAGDILNLTFTNPALPGGSRTVSYTTLVGDGSNSLAIALAAAVNADTVLIAAGISAAAPQPNNVVNISYQAQNGQLRFSSSVSPGSETITLPTAPTETITVGTNATETVVIGTGSTAVVAASATATVGGSETDADVINLVFTNAGVTGFPVTISHTTSGSESINAIAAALNTAINANAVLAAANVSSTVATATLTIKQLGVIGNTTVLSYTQGGNSETITFVPSNGHLGGGAGVVGGAMTGGDGPIFATNNFEFAPSNGGISAFYYGQPYQVGYDVISQMVAQGMPIT